MSTASLRLVIDGVEREFNFLSSLEMEILSSSPRVELKIKRIESFATLICQTYLDVSPPDNVRLFMVGRSVSGYMLVRAGDWMFPTLVRTLCDFKLIKTKELRSQLKKHQDAIALKSKLDIVSEVFDLLGKVGIELNKKQEARVEAYAAATSKETKMP